MRRVANGCFRSLAATNFQTSVGMYPVSSECLTNLTHGVRLDMKRPYSRRLGKMRDGSQRIFLNALANQDSPASIFA